LHVQTLERIVAQVNKALDLSRQLLSLSSDQQDSAGQCSVKAVVESALQDTVRPLKKDGIETDVQVPEGLQAKGSAVLIEQVLLNLVLNARAALKGQRGRIAMAARQDGDFVEIDVHDSGCGMADQQRAALMDFLADRSTELIPRPSGVGLGLQLCRLIVTQQGGTLRMSTSPIGGCHFTVRLPAAAASLSES
jgi:signal transduction histidine kinase